MEPDQGNEFKVKGEEMLRKIKEIVHEGNVRRIIIKDDKGETYVEIPSPSASSVRFSFPCLPRSAPWRRSHRTSPCRSSAGRGKRKKAPAKRPRRKNSLPSSGRRAVALNGGAPFFPRGQNRVPGVLHL